MDVQESTVATVAGISPAEDIITEIHPLSHTPPHTPPVKSSLEPAHPHPEDRPLIEDTLQVDVDNDTDSSPFLQPHLTPSRVNGNRQPRLDASLSGTSTLSTDDDGSASSSDSSSDSEDDLLNSSAMTEEGDDEEVDVEVDSDVNRDDVEISETVRTNVSQIKTRFETEEYPGDEDDMGLDLSDDDDDEDASQELNDDAVRKMCDIVVDQEPLQFVQTDNTNTAVVNEVGSSSGVIDTDILEQESDKVDDTHNVKILSESSDTTTMAIDEDEDVNIEEAPRISEFSDQQSEDDLNTNCADLELVNTNTIQTSIETNDNTNIIDIEKSDNVVVQSNIKTIQTSCEANDNTGLIAIERSENEDTCSKEIPVLVKDMSEVAETNTQVDTLETHRIWSSRNGFDVEGTSIINDDSFDNEPDADLKDALDANQQFESDIKETVELGANGAEESLSDMAGESDTNFESGDEKIELAFKENVTTSIEVNDNLPQIEDEPDTLFDDDMDIEPDVNIPIPEHEICSTDEHHETSMTEDGSEVCVDDFEPNQIDQPDLINSSQEIRSNIDNHTIVDEESDVYIEDIEPITPKPLHIVNEELDISSSVDHQHINDNRSDDSLADGINANHNLSELVNEELDTQSSVEQDIEGSSGSNEGIDEPINTVDGQERLKQGDVKCDIENESQVEDMDLEEDYNHREYVIDERTMSVPPSPQKIVAPSNPRICGAVDLESTTTESSLLTNVLQEVSTNIIQQAPETRFSGTQATQNVQHTTPESFQHQEDIPLNSTSTAMDDTHKRRSSCSSLVPNSTEALPDMLMSPPSFKNTDEMKYFLKHQLQYSDLGKLFGNVDVSSVMGSGQGNEYAQYLGLQPSVKFKCFKCSESNFASLAELKQHQATCLKQIPNVNDRPTHSPRGSTVGLRSSLNSDNAMDVDLTETAAAKCPTPQSTVAPGSVPETCQQIDAKIRITRKVYLCSACGTYYENWNLFYHMREVHQKFICLLCLGIFPSGERLVHHMENKHNARPAIYEHKEQLMATLKDPCYMMCTVCEHVFSEHDDFTSHSCENYIKACALCGLKFIHKPQCKAGASNKALSRQRRDKMKGKHRQKKTLLGASNNNAASNVNNAASEVGEPSGLNFSNTLFGGSTSSINGILSGNFELPQSILSNQIPDAPGDSYVVPPLAPEPPLSYLPQKLLQDDKPQEYPTNSSSSSMSSSSYVQSFSNNPSTTLTHPRSSGKIWPPLNNGYIDPPDTQIKTQNFNQTNHNNNHSASGQAPTTVAPTSNHISSGKNISLFDHRESLSISEDYLDNRDMEILSSYISGFDHFSQGGSGKNVSLTDIEPMQPIKSPSPRPALPEQPPVVDPPRLVPKLKLNLSKAFQTPIESEESSTESDEDEEEDDEAAEEEAAEDEAEDEEDEDEEVNQAEEERFKLASKMYQTPSNASRTPHPMSPHSFAAPSIPPPTPPHLHRSIADSDMQIDVERTSDMAIDETQDEDEEPSTVPSHHPNEYPQHINNRVLGYEPCTNDPESEDVNIEDEDKESSAEGVQSIEEPIPDQPLVPFDGIHLADEETLPTELLLTQPIDRIPIQDFLRLCIKATYPYCLYCNHARKIAVDGHHLALHMLAHHRFKATVDSITAEELLPVTIVQSIKSHLDDLSNIYFNLDTFNTADPSKNVISPKSFECFQCRFQARHHKDLYLHNRKMHLKTIVVCLMCKANFYSYSELSGHICPGHPKPNDTLDVHFRCVLCNLDRIPSAFRLMVHLRKKHGACDICLEYCDDQSRLSSHVCKHKLHHLCYRCGISYRNKADITKHLFWKHGTESQLCKKCLQKKWPHVYHFCVPPASFVCEVCSISFKRAVALKVHKRLHSDDHPYPCTEDGCEKKFISRKLLLKHVARHSAVNEPEEVKPVEPSIVAELKPEADVKKESKAEATTEVEEKPSAPKPLIDIIKDLPAPNLSESDSSDESDTDQRSRPVSRSLLPNNISATDPAGPDDDEQQAPIANIWDNFKSYQANQKQTHADEDREHDPAPPPELHVVQSDHDYCEMYKKAMAAKKFDKFVPLLEIKQEPMDEDEVAAQQQSPVAKPRKAIEAKLNKSPKKGRSPKKALDKSGSESSSSDSDSSCSCGSNCSCTSGSSSDGSSSSSSSSSGDSSSSEGRRKKAAKLAKRRQQSNQSPAKDEPTENIDVGTEEKKTTPINDPDLIILESDLETDESETDEEFYDEHPLRMANQLLAEKRKQLMLQTSMNPLNSFDIVENSRPSTPSLPPAEEELKSRKQKTKKRKKDRKNSKCVPSLKLNLSTQSVTIVEEPQQALPPPMVYQQLPQPSPAPPKVAPIAHDTNLSRFNSNFQAYNLPATIQHQLKPRLSTGSSCSDADSSLKRSKRRRIPNKFYGYTSDEDATPSGTVALTPQEAFKPQPPPNLTWNKEDLPQTPTVIRTPPIKTIIKLPTGKHSSFTRNSSLDYPSIDSNPRFNTASPHMEQPPALPARHSQPPIPPIIIRPNRVIQPPLVEPLRVPAVPVHHIVPPSQPDTEADSDSSDSDSSNEGHLQIQQTPVPPVVQHTPPPPFQRLITTPLRITPSMLAAKTPKPRPAANRKRPAPKFPSTPKAKRSKNDHLPKTPAIPAQYLPFLDPPEPVHQPRSMTTHIPISAVANQIRYPIMPPAGSRPARAGESVYCYCRCPYDEVSEMIACDGDDCPIEWFHFECVNIMVPPKGTWYCPQCRPKYATHDDDDEPAAM